MADKKGAGRRLVVHDVVLRDGRLGLRPLTEDDWDLLLKWHNDPRWYDRGAVRRPRPLELFNRRPGAGRGWTLRELRESYRHVSRRGWPFVIEIPPAGGEAEAFAAGKPIGVALLRPMNLRRWLSKYPRRVLRRVDLLVGEKKEWGKGYGTAAIRQLTDLAFRQGAAMVFACGVADQNPGCRRVLEKCGYRLAGRDKGRPNRRAPGTIDLVADKSRMTAGQKEEREVKYP